MTKEEEDQEILDQMDWSMFYAMPMDEFVSPRKPWNRARRAALALAASSLLLLTGCVHQYAKVGVTPEDATRARAWCEMRKPPIEQPFMDNCMASQGFVVRQ